MTHGHCMMCGAFGPVHAHHMTGRARPGADYLDPALVLLLCPRCHVGGGGVHQMLRVSGLEFPAPTSHLLAHRVQRVAFHGELSAANGRAFVLLAPSVPSFAALLWAAAGRGGAPSVKDVA